MEPGMNPALCPQTPGLGCTQALSGALEKAVLVSLGTGMEMAWTQFEHSAAWRALGKLASCLRKSLSQGNP